MRQLYGWLPHISGKKAQEPLIPHKSPLYYGGRHTPPYIWARSVREPSVSFQFLSIILLRRLSEPPQYRRKRRMSLERRCCLLSVVLLFYWAYGRTSRPYELQFSAAGDNIHGNRRGHYPMFLRYFLSICAGGEITCAYIADSGVPAVLRDLSRFMCVFSQRIAGYVSPHILHNSFSNTAQFLLSVPYIGG